jgi:hypothetical protein
MIATSTLRAKIGGLLRDKVEISGKNFNRCSTEEAVKELLCLHGLEHPTQEQVEQAVASLRSEFAEHLRGRAPITIDATPQRLRLLRKGG